DYVQGLATYLPTLTSELGTLNDFWGESGETIEDSMTSYHKLMSVVKAITLSYADFTKTIMELSLAQDTAASLGTDLGRSFEMVGEFVGELANIVPTLANELDSLDDVWKENQETVNKGAVAFGNAMKPIRTISGGMLDLGNVMVIAGDDIGGKFDSITDYIGKLTDFTPRLGLALSGLKTVWDENSGAINDGTTAFSNIVGAISDVQTSIGDLITAEGDLETAAGDATTAVDDESDALAGHSLSTSLDTTVASSAILQAATVALIGVMGPLTGAVSTVAAALSGELVDALDVAAKGAVRFMNDFVAGIFGVIPTIEEASWLAGKPLADSFSSAADHVAGIVETLGDR
ncbi:hypothetical protein KAW18_17975, partial [candidate division WOR-3 bacterium]|nr:hypothetical protein [candidate division WOR-3 bacterium]